MDGTREIAVDRRQIGWIVTWGRAAARLIVATMTVQAIAPHDALAQAVFEPTPAWLSGGSLPTEDIALGDVDADGDLDLVSGNHGSSLTLHRNLGDTFESAPAWSSGRGDFTTSVALGDVDADGDLDLVCGNLQASPTLYRNVGGIFDATPAWDSGRADFTSSVALGDVDGDGDLDLVCGVLKSSATWYRNSGGTFEDAPVWDAGHADLTSSIALGDVDGDRDLDLVCGNNTSSPTLYRNVGGTFENLPAWNSGRADPTQDVTLGDIDGDGDLDLICNNNGSSPTWYRNVGGIFEDLPAWGSGRGDRGLCAALGDVDGDGDLDLVCGNDESSPTLYRNTGGTFEDVPAWDSGRADPTTGVALVDVDADGDLDLVCGNANASLTWYRNTSATFESLPTWDIGPSGFTTSIALGDVDSDRDLDLLLGYSGSSPALFRNTGGTFDDVPAWDSGQADPTQSIALGDVDDDGDLDLVCGNYKASPTLYRNVGEIFENVPAWDSGSADEVVSIALGDVDADGDLDLVCANASWGPSLYWNAGGTFEDLPAWGVVGNPITSLALGDVDNDADLDLICGNYLSSPTLYRNVDGLFESTPIWDSGREDRTTSVALGDVDGDGDLDLICGNDGSSPTLYRSTGGTFEDTPAWASGRADHTTSVALGDVDADGDLDLVCGFSDVASAALYRNVGGTFESSPAWIAGRTNITEGVALGDVDADGDLDLVCGNADSSSTLYPSKYAPAYRGVPTAPTNQTTNTDAFLRSVRVESGGPNTYHAQFTAIDVESDPIWIVAEYQVRGGAWQAIPALGGGPRFGPFASSPSGEAHEIDLDLLSVPVGRPSVVLRFRTISNPRVGVAQRIPVYLFELGPVEVHRPVVTTSVSSIPFPRLTAGSTVSDSLTIINAGNEDLLVSAIESPPRVILHGVADLPISLASRASMRFEVQFHPLEPQPPVAPLRIHSNDPLTPVLEVSLLADVRSIAVRTRALVRTPAPLGEAATIQAIQVDSLARVARAFLHYRPRGDSAFSAQEMFSFGTGWVGFVPGSSVRESGVEYYVEVQNGDVTLFDPPPGENAPFEFDVEPAAALAVTAERTSRSGFAPNVDIPIRIDLPQGADFVRGFLYYRQGGKTRFDSTQLATGAQPEVLLGTIPAPVATHRGLEYRVALQTTGNPSPLHYPSIGAPASSDTIRVSVTSLVEPTRHPGERYRMVSVPLGYGSRSGITLETLLSDQPEFGPYDPFRWRAFRYFNGVSVELTHGDSLFLPDPGRAFWLISKSEHVLDTAPTEGLSPSRPREARGRRVVLLPGWNQIANPFGFPVAWSQVTFEDTTAIKDLTAFDPNLGARGDYALDEPVVLQPFDGYFLRNTSTRQLRIWVPWVEAGEPLQKLERDAAAVRAARRNRPATLDQWSLQLTGRTAEAEDGANVFGVDPAASDLEDALDRGEPPSPPGAWVRVAFGALRRDLRGTGSSFQAWDVEISTHERGHEVTLDLLLDTGLPADLAVKLLDQETHATVDLFVPHGESTALDTYRLLAYGPERIYRLTLLAGTPEDVAREAQQRTAIPTAVALDQNAPNPFNATTRLRFGLPQAAPTTLEIFNVRGEIVATLLRNEQRAAGYHSVLWHGTDHAGRSVASGVYICRLQSAGTTMTRRLVVMK